MSWYVDMCELYANDSGLDIRVAYFKQKMPWVMTLSEFDLPTEFLFNGRREYVFLAVY